ncbi:MAG: serine hydrolase domain-containing protein, partial [Ginsengibacter sp.]
MVPFLIFFSCCAFTSSAQQNKLKLEELTKTVDRILQSQVNKNVIPGAVIEIKKGNQVLCRKAFGDAQQNDYDNKLLAHPEEMTTDDLFDLASLTKVVGTTTSIMLLVDRGLIKIEDPVGKYISAFNTESKKQITI